MDNDDYPIAVVIIAKIIMIFFLYYVLLINIYSNLLILAVFMTMNI